MSQIFSSPLEQFEIIVLQPFLVGKLDFSFTNAALYNVVVFSFLFMFFYLAISRPYLLPSRWQTLAEGFYGFVLDMVSQQAGKKAYLYFPFVYNYVFLYSRFKFSRFNPVCFLL